MPEIDLHTHSTASDGTDSPAELIRAAAEAGLRAMALTDHDTAAGLAEAAAEAEKAGIEFVPGCEMAVALESRNVDILGLWLPVNPEKLNRALEHLHEERLKRNEQIIAKLRKQGINIDYEDVLTFAEGTVGRPHIARALLHFKVVNSIQDAFDRYLGMRGRAYVPKKVFTPEEAIALLKDEGASVFLAHPGLYGFSDDYLDALIRRLLDAGLDGIEVWHSEHTAQEVRRLLELAENYDLAVSGGSDYHGSVKPRIQIGTGRRNNLALPYSVLEELKARRKAQGLPV